MTRSLLIGTLCVTLLVPGLLVADGPNSVSSTQKPGSSLTASNITAAAPQDQQPTTVRPNSTTQQRSYEREVHPRHRRHVSKGEIVFMGGIAGTSMAIGALAGGPTGLAIGAIVGGWGAYAGHRIWHWVNK